MSAYWIAHVRIKDSEHYAQYTALAPFAFDKYSAKFIARGGEFICMEGEQYERHVIIEFPDMETAKSCYASEEYTKARLAREKHADVMINIVEGLN